MVKILSGSRDLFGRVVTPLARALVRAGVSPDAVTIAGTVGVIIAAAGFAARGEILLATLIAALAALTDLIDGVMARIRGQSSRWGALLDSSMDRVADAAVFAGPAYWYATTGERLAAVVAVVALVAAQLVSYVRARAEGLGLSAKVGIMERPERMVLIGVGGLLEGFGVPHGLHAILWVLAVLSIVTVVQRLVHVRRQAFAADQPVPDPVDPADAT